MARRGPVAFRILAGLVGIGIGVVAALMVLFAPHHAKTPATLPATAQPQGATNGA